MRPAGAPRRRSVAASASLRLGASILGATISIANVIVVARALGPAGRGEVVLFATVAFISANLALGGLQEANANIGASEPWHRRELATNSVLLALALGGLVAAALFGLIELFPQVGGTLDGPVLALALVAIPVVVLQIYLQGLAQADYAFGIVNGSYLAALLLTLAANGLLWAVGRLTVTAAVVAWVAGQLVATCAVGWYVARRLAGFGRANVSLAVRSLRFGLRSHVGRIMLLGNFRLDHWLVGSMSGSRELGHYSVATAWSETLFYLPTAVAFVQRPDLVRSDEREAGRRAAAAFRASLLLTVPSAVAIVVAAPVLCVGFFGSDFAASVTPLRILVLGSFGIAAIEILGYALVARGRPGAQTVAIGIGFASMLILDLLLIPRYGGEGAALASTLAYTAAGLCVAAAFVRGLGVSLRDLRPRVREGASMARAAVGSVRRSLRATGRERAS
jgi:O-antigen/teichoic acid export membrane protein